MTNEWKIIECNKYTGGKWSPKLLERLTMTSLYNNVGEQLLTLNK